MSDLEHEEGGEHNADFDVFLGHELFTVYLGSSDVEQEDTGGCIGFCVLQLLSDLEHEEDGEHNANYDHNAFLGHELFTISLGSSGVEQEDTGGYNGFCVLQGLSDLEHEEDGEHNADYDHDAFLGHEDKKTFDQLSPEESKDRLR